MADGWLTAREATEALGIGAQTLYAYVSRGLIRSRPGEDGRSKRYRADDIETLRRRKTTGRRPEAVAANALHFGTPVLESELSLIADGRLHYRGRDACALARSASLEDVARLLWPADGAAFAHENLPPFAGLRRLWLAVAGLPPLERCLSLLPQAEALDRDAWALDPAALRLTGGRLVRLLAAAVAGVPPSPAPVHETLCAAWRVPAERADLVRAALVLSADHELNASTFAARVVAATGATAYSVVAAGLAALSGPRHGGLSSRVTALLEALAPAVDPRPALVERVRQRIFIPGFGHPLYPDGDPRARHLLDLLAERLPREPRARHALAVATAAEALLGRKANVDFPLAAIERGLALPKGAALGLFLLGRSVGWIAHMLEQAARPDLIRPRARYVGPPPEAETAAQPAAPARSS